MRGTINNMDGNDAGRRKSPGVGMVLLLFSVAFLRQFQQVQSLSLSQRSPSCLSKVALRAQRNTVDAGDIDTKKNLNFFQRSGRRIDDNSGSTTGYVPSGMSRAEYSAIRKAETEREGKMNYGAWGPRFRPSDRPEGDWMVMPNLWTFGRIDDNRKRFTGDENGESYGIRDRIRSLRQAHGVAFLLGYVMVDSLCCAFGLWKLRQLRDATMLRTTAFGLACTVCSILLNATGIFPGYSSRIKSTFEGQTAASILKINALKLPFVMLQIPLWNDLMERSNRRWLWSKNRFAVIITSAALMGLTIAGMVLTR